MIPAMIIVCVIAVAMLLCWRSEVRAWNKGSCPCGGKWTYFDTDSQGGRGYDCSKCHRVIWISWFTPQE